MTIGKEIEKEIKMLERAVGEESYRYTAESVAHSKIRLNIYQAWLADSKAQDEKLEDLEKESRDTISAMGDKIKVLEGLLDHYEMYLEKAEAEPKLTAEEAKDFARFLNGWADHDKHAECALNNKRTVYGDGYDQAVRDIIKKIGYKRFEEWLGYGKIDLFAKKGVYVNKGVKA
jgi:hypothetical protein